MIKTILYASDLGMYGPYLMKQVSELASGLNATVDILHVIEPMGVFAESIINSYVSEKDLIYLRDSGMDDVFKNIKSQVLDSLRSEYSRSLVGVSMGEVIVEQGDPAERILALAELRRSSMIAMGSHSQQVYRGNLIGSVVAKVLQLSPVPVYMVPMMSLNDLDRGTL